MYGVLIKLIVVVSLMELGITFSRSGDCVSRVCWTRLQRASREVVRVEWRPISVFPEEGRRFRGAAK